MDVYGESRQVLYQVAPGVDFLVHDDLALAGHNGTLELKLAYLKRQLAQGKLNLLEYAKERKRILGGGATSVPSPPGTDPHK